MSLQALQAGCRRSDVERFRSEIVRQIGLQFEDAKLAFLREVLQRRLDRLCCSSAGYLERLERDSSRDEVRALAQELTVGETYFFRHMDQFRALAEVALPERMRERRGCRTLSILSAGCASGEEAYSLAIVAQESIKDPSWHIAIRGIDLNPVALGKAARGRYSAWALREAPADMQRIWFRAENRDLLLNQTVRDAVQFNEGNLASGDPELWLPSAYDVIFCRNVLMYFAPAQMRQTIARLAESLAPGGYLFLGHAETLRGVSDAFELCHTHDTFYYKRKPHAAPAPQQPRAGTGSLPATSVVACEAASSTAWVDTIRQASERVAALMPPAAATNSTTPSASGRWTLAPVFDLLRDERFVEALAYICDRPSNAESDPDVLLVKAVLWAQGGQLALAQEACQRLLLIDEFNAGAHYVIALCREHLGEFARAMEHDRRAAHLDPSFAMPRLHRGLLARGAGDRDTARDELSAALVLLRREDISRLLLFGGGFTRDALIALCRSAAAGCGERR